MGIDIFQLPGILLRRWLYVVVTAVLCIGLAGGFVVLRKPTFVATADILIDPQGLSASPPDPRLAAGTASQDAAAIDSQTFVIQSREVLNPVSDQLKLISDRFLNPAGIADREQATIAVVAGLRKNLTIEREGQSFVLSLTVKHRDPAMASKIANTIAAVYLKRLHEARADASSRASGAFELQARDLAEKLRHAEEELEKFKAANNLVATGPQQNLVIDQQVEGVNRQLIAARADLELKRANYDQVKALTVGSIAAGGIPEALVSTALSTMRGRYAELAARADQLSVTLGANHPQMRAARSQADGLRQEMEEELARIRESMKGAMQRAEANAAALQKRLDALTTSSLDTSEAGIQARALQSQVDALRALYKTLLTRASELGQGDTVNVNNSRVISAAVPGAGSGFMLKLIIIAAGGLFGIALGSGIAVLREIIGRAMVARSSSDVTEPMTTAPAIVADARVEIVEETPPSASGELPVIAHIPATRSSASRLTMSGRKFVESGDVDRKTRIGVSRTVDTLLRHSPEAGPSTVLFISPDNDNGFGRILPDLASALHRLDKEVLYSAGDGGHGVNATEAPLGDMLNFNRLTRGKPKHGTSRPAPTFSTFSGSRRKADFIIIDANGEAARHHLAELLDRASAILLVGRDGDEGHLDELVDSLSPWRDRMLGTIKLDKTA
jgi:polysaccharide biosynthesis transport protein